jgi:hypothetical protein
MTATISPDLIFKLIFCNKMIGPAYESRETKRINGYMRFTRFSLTDASTA